jgi:hypothetical protein
MARQQRVLRLAPDRLSAYDLCLRAKSLTWKFRPQANAEARALAERALALNPQNALAHAIVSTTHHVEWVGCWVIDRAHALDQAHLYARRAVGLDRDDSFARWRLAEVLHYRGAFLRGPVQSLAR